MALNKARTDGAGNYVLPVLAGTLSGDPVVVSTLPGVALNDADASDEATVTTTGAYRFDVEASAGAISPGDQLYLASYLGSPVLSNDAGGDFWGYALESVGNALTVEIEARVGY